MLLLLLAASSLPAAEPATQAILRYVPDDFHEFSRFECKDTEVVFKKEPDFGGRTVMRSALTLKEKPPEFIGFAWDITRFTLHVDVNRNLDLTDDPAGSYTCHDGFGTAQEFKGVRLEGRRGQVPVTYVVDLTFQPRMKEMRCYAVVRSGWKGTVRLDGVDWTLGLVDVVGQSDVLVLSRGEERETEIRMALPSTLQIDRQCRDLDLRFRATGKEPEVVAVLAPSTARLGTVELSGERIHRIDLRRYGPDGHVTSIQHAPGPTMQVPVGTYRAIAVHLDGGPRVGRFTAWLDPPGAPRVKRFEVAPGRPMKLVAGAPLRSEIKVKRSGARMRIEAVVLGAAGEKYRAQRAPIGKGASFTISQGGSPIATGSFEYG